MYSLPLFQQQPLPHRSPSVLSYLCLRSWTLHTVRLPDLPVPVPLPLSYSLSSAISSPEPYNTYTLPLRIPARTRDDNKGTEFQKGSPWKSRSPESPAKHRLPDLLFHFCPCAVFSQKMKSDSQQNRWDATYHADLRCTDPAHNRPPGPQSLYKYTLSILCGFRFHRSHGILPLPALPVHSLSVRYAPAMHVQMHPWERLRSPVHHIQ